MTKADYVARVVGLVGQRIVGVRYHELLYTDEKNVPLFGSDYQHPEFDSLDFGLDLDFEDGSMCHITWGSEFFSYGVSLLPRAEEYNIGIRIWNVATESRWRDLINQQIVSADLYWSCVQYEDDPKPIEYPQSLRLAFEGGAEVCISAFEVRDDSLQFGCADNIAVFFDCRTAASFGAWPNAK